MLKILTKTFIVVSLLLSVEKTQAQTFAQRSEISVGPEVGIPIGSFRDEAKFGFGGTVKYVFAVDKTYGLTLQSGIVGYIARERMAVPYPGAPSIDYNFNAIPIKLGGRYRYKCVFAEPQIGLTYFSNQHLLQNTSTLTYGINVGGYLSKHLTLEGNFERWNRGGYNHIGLRLAYNFHIGK